MPRCKECKTKFEAYEFNGKFCKEIDCQVKKAMVLLDKKKTMDKKDWNKEKKVRKDALKTREDYFQDALVMFNSFIRARDKNNPCISCDKPAGQYRLTSGHFYPQGTYRNIALDERNAHGQCWFNCNKNKSGNLHEYRPRLINKIGIKIVEQLDIDAQQKVGKQSIEELKEIKNFYRLKIKALE